MGVLWRAVLPLVLGERRFSSIFLGILELLRLCYFFLYPSLGNFFGDDEQSLLSFHSLILVNRYNTTFKSVMIATDSTPFSDTSIFSISSKMTVMASTASGMFLGWRPPVGICGSVDVR